MTAYCSYMKQLSPCALVRPMARRHPYSQTLSRIFEVVLISKRKNARVSAIAPTMRTKMLNTLMAESKEPIDCFLSSKKID